MESKLNQHQASVRTSPSRRAVLRSATGVLAGGATAALAQFGNSSRTGRVVAYVGTYTPNGQGIHLFDVNLSNGNLTKLTVVPANNPSWLALHPMKTFMYAANEISNFNGGTTGAVSAYSVSVANGNLTLLNMMTSGGAGPAHLSVDPSGKFVLVANYGGGNVAVLPILANGSLGNPTDVKNDTSACSPACPVGPVNAVNGPPGSFAISGHDAPHAHMIQTDATGNFAFVQDLGLDLTIVYKFDRVNGKLLSPKTVPSSAGAGPRHFGLHPNGKWFYSLNEESSTLTFMRWDGASGTLTPVEETTTLPKGFEGTNFTSEVILSNHGRFIYCLNRLHNSIAVFEVEDNGRPKLVSETLTRADYPRNCAIDPTGSFLYVCHNRSDNVTAFRVNPGSGKLTFTGDYTGVGSPSVITFLN
jgi:6-phosphogluconolactonase